MSSQQKEYIADLSSCRSCVGWERWGKGTKQRDTSDTVVAKNRYASEAQSATTASPRSGTTGSPRKDDCASEMTSVELTSPRMTPPSSARSAIAKHLPQSQRRSCRVSFVQNFGFDVDTDEELNGFEDVIRDCMAESQAPENCQPIASAVHLGESDSEIDDVSDEEEDIYDEYDFDHTKISEMVKAGAEREKLTTAIEEAMAAALERKLKEKSLSPTKEVVSADNPYALGLVGPGDTIHDISDCMTPGRMTPTEDTTNINESVAERMQQALESAKLRRRRSSAARKGVRVIAEAKQAAAMRRRASLAARMCDERESVQDVISQAMQGANRRHRQSISKASEVLEDVGYGDSTQLDEVTANMNLIEVAMAEARRRHRRSIARAVEQLQEPPIEGALNPSAEVFVPENCQGVVWHEELQGNQSLDVVASQFQPQITQAISSAYQTHCLAEQQTYGYYGNSDQSCNNVWSSTSDSGSGYCSQGMCQDPSGYCSQGMSQGPQHNVQNMSHGSFHYQGGQESQCYSAQECSHMSGHQTQVEWTDSAYPQNNPNGVSNCYHSNPSTQINAMHGCSYDIGDQHGHNGWSQASNCHASVQGQCAQVNAMHGCSYDTGDQQGHSGWSQASNCCAPMQGQCVQVNAMHGCSYDTGHQQGHSGWSQESNCCAPIQGQCFGANNYQGSVNTYSQSHVQTAPYNQYSQDSHNQDASWQYAAANWTEHGDMSGCDSYISYQ